MKEMILEKLDGLYKVYYEVKHNYPNKQRLKDIMWDEKLREYEKLVIDSESVYDYYVALMKYISLVDDGHTTIMPPWLLNPKGFSKPAIELEYIDGEMVISRVGNVKELRESNIFQGDVITHINDLDVNEAFKEINSIYSKGSKQANEKVNPYFLLLGDEEKKVTIKLKKSNKTIELTRSIVEDDGKYFMDRIIDFKNPLTIKELDKGIYYIHILSFSSMSIADHVIEVLSKDPKGIIFDLRLNMGGNDQVSTKIISHLIKEPVKSPIWRCEFYNQAFDLWGLKSPSQDIQNTINPADEKTYSNPIVVLTSGMTASTAEDMTIILKHAKRAKIIGEKTAGSSGNPKTSKLPFGGILDVSSFIPLTPNKEEYLGVGIEPDIICKNTKESITEGKDLVLEKAISLISN